MNSLGAEYESNSERLRSYSGAKDMSIFAAASCCCYRNKRSIVKLGGWNCPHCSMRSPRHWNVRRHISRVHDGFGEPTNEFGKTREEQQRQMNTNLQSLAMVITTTMVRNHAHFYSRSQGLVSAAAQSKIQCLTTTIIINHDGTLWMI